MSIEPTSEDMAAAKAQGDLVETLLAAAGRTRKRSTRPEPTADSSVKTPPFTTGLHRPGAWPSGTRPVGPNTCDPGCDCALNQPPDGAP
jgi:hypothetical protein